MCEISTLLLSYVVSVKSKVEISQNFVAFSDYMIFTWCRLLRRGISIGCTFGLSHWSSDCLTNQHLVTFQYHLCNIPLKFLAISVHCHTETTNGSNQPQNKFSSCDFMIFFNELSAYWHHFRFRSLLAIHIQNLL